MGEQLGELFLGVEHGNGQQERLLIAIANVAEKLHHVDTRQGIAPATQAVAAGSQTYAEAQQRGCGPTGFSRHTIH